MTALSIQPTFPIFTDAAGEPLENGYIWIGTTNLDPQVNQINVYWDAALTQLAAQPIRTLNGYPSNSGTPARLYVNSDYSIRVMNKNASVVYSAPAATERLSDVVVGGVNASEVVYDPAGTGAVATTVQTKLRESVSIQDFGAISDGTTDDAAAVNAAITAVAALGGGDVKFPAGTTLVGSTIYVADNVHLVGAGQKATTIKLKASANVNIIQKKAGASGIGAGLFDLTIDGNDANNTNGGIYWAGASTGRGPAFTFERVTVQNCRPIASAPSGEYGAIVTTGSTWGVARDLDITQNQYAVGWWHKGSDWQIDNLYLGPNGASYGGTGTHSMIVQAGAGNLFTSCYFGGNGGYAQVMFWGSDRNLLVNCINDNAWENAYRFVPFSGSGSDNNRILGGQIRGASGKTNAGFPAVYIDSSNGNIFSDVEWSGNAHTSSGNAASYGLQEAGTATGNYIIGGNLASSFQTNFYSLAGSSTTMVTSVFGWDSSDIQIATVKKRVNVTGPYDGAAPSTSSVPLFRANNGGAISLWASGTAYSYLWLQGIQDDGSNNLKPIRINPLGGGVVVGGNLEPITDNTQTLGGASSRWSVVYAGTGTINTSDKREKQQVRGLSDAERAVAVKLKGLVRAFKFNDAVAAKGDGARIHVGVIAQEVMAAFQAEGLDPLRYAIVCYDEWDAELDDDGNELRPAGNRYGVRYEELLAFIIAAL